MVFKLKIVVCAEGKAIAVKLENVRVDAKRIRKCSASYKRHPCHTSALNEINKRHGVYMRMHKNCTKTNLIQ